MLIALTAALSVTALLAGFAGSWSPCGLSSIETIGAGAGRHPSRRLRGVTLAVFTLGCLVGGTLTFGGAALLGEALGTGPGHEVAAVLAAVVALVCGAADARFWRVVPQIRNQVPEPIRRRAPLPVTGALYGLLLGLGFVTYLLTYAMWALLAASLLVGTPWIGVAVGLAFGVGRALPVIALAGRFERAETRAFIEDMEHGPLLLGLRRIDGVALVACAALLLPIAAAGAAQVPDAAGDPSADGAVLAYVAPDGEGRLRRGDGTSVPLPGRHPAVGGGLVAWHDGDDVTVADAATLAPVATLTIPHVDGLALTERWLAYRTTTRRGSAVGVIRPSGTGHRVLERIAAPGSLSRPAIAGTTVVYAVTGARSSRIVSRSVRGAGRHVLRRGRAGAVVGQPSVYGRTLLYVRATPCAQTLLLGPRRPAAHGDRTLLRLRGTARRDPGHEPGYIDAYDAASRCPRRSYSRLRGTLWTTALGRTRAYVTRLAPSGANRIVQVRR